MDMCRLFCIVFCLILNCLYIETQGACTTSGWFGSSCQYQCHCNTGSTCDVNGQCSSRCATGWFGEGCQYQDLSTVPGATVSTSVGQAPTWLTDGNDTTCVPPNQNIQWVKTSWNISYVFTWLRIKVNDSSLKQNFNLNFRTANNQIVNCISPLISTIATSIDYRCDVNETIQELTVTGTSLKYLCSLYISGGKNVALRQSATQTSSYDINSLATLAVDGNTNGIFNNHSCTHSANGDQNPKWTLTLDTAKVVNRFVLYNRVDCCSERLKSFKLEIFDTNNTSLWTYLEPGNMLWFYTVTATIKNPVSKIQITPSGSPPVLTLCEVFVFRDCVPGTWGLECNNNCPQNCSTTCHQDTGQCISCAGYSNPPNCTTACLPGTYGLDCQYNCSKNCYNTSCNMFTGECDVSCNGYSNFPQCTTECPNNKWGLNCQNNCSVNCYNNSCDKLTGVCDKGCNGFSNPPNCNVGCDFNKWGLNCSKNCSTNCFNQSCNSTTGVCSQGCLGYSNPPSCTTECSSGKWGQDCVQTCNSSCYNTSCDRLNGVCDKGCNGYSNPPQCTQECSLDKWGHNCSSDCDYSCYNQSCDRVTGRCNEGCNGFSDPPNCTVECSFDRWGKNCINNCSFRCYNQSCSRTSGDCNQGCYGYSDPPNCTQECTATSWGINCSNSCSPNCYNTSCDKLTGMCNQGCNGYMDPPNCTQACQSSYYGINCSFNCSPTCKGRLCNSITGFCITCEDGYLGTFCEQVCKNHTYGPNCGYNCSQFCSVSNDTSQNRCDPVNGVCQYGCVSGYTKSNCSESISAADTNVGAIVGPIIAVLIVVAVLVILAIILLRRRKAAKKNAAYKDIKSFSQLSNNSQTSDKPLFSHINGESLDTSTYSNIERHIPEDTAIFVSDLPSYLHSHSAEFLKDQYQKIPLPKNVTLDIGLCEENKPKNRFKNVCPYDHSRVHLKINTAKHEGDYINASYIRGFNDEVTFIASQGPNSVVINDFVRMLWEQKVDNVVMLTNLIEEGKVKCDKYWPDENKVKFGDIKLRLISTKTFADYTIRQIEISKKDDATHLFTHFHFTSWPDQGVPSAPWSLVDLEQRVASSSTARPIVVHCSAGVGRTGTFIALYNIIRQAEHTGKVDFFKTLAKLREDRMLMIQTAEQYEFLHRAAHVAVVCMGKTISSIELSDRIKILEDKIFTGQSQVDKEFKAVCTVASSCTKEEQQLDDDNNIYQNADKQEKKNRFSAIIPKLIHKPYLARENADMGDYINAVFLPGFQRKDQHFLTQLPLPVTVIDLYRLIVQYKVSLMVVFELDKMDSDKTIGNYLPTRYEEPLSCPPFVVHSSLSKQDQLYEEHILNVHSKSEKCNVNHLRCKFTDLDAQKWFVFMKKIKSYNIQGDEKIIYMCRNGAEFSGLACTLSLLIDRMEFDSCLTVPMVVGAIKTVRPEVIPTLDQYRTLYHVLEKYIETSTIYTNVGDDFFRKSFSKAKKLTIPDDESENIYNNEDNQNVYSNF